MASLLNFHLNGLFMGLKESPKVSINATMLDFILFLINLHVIYLAFLVIYRFAECYIDNLNLYY